MRSRTPTDLHAILALVVSASMTACGKSPEPAPPPSSMGRMTDTLRTLSRAACLADDHEFVDGVDPAAHEWDGLVPAVSRRLREIELRRAGCRKSADGSFIYDALSGELYAAYLPSIANERDARGWFDALEAAGLDPDLIARARQAPTTPEWKSKHSVFLYSRDRRISLSLISLPMESLSLNVGLLD